jgi:hypothetical protein
MELPDLHLDEQTFKDTPTTTQMVNLLRDLHKFLSRCGGMLIASNSYAIGDNPIGAMLNGAIQLKAAADMFEQGPNAAGLAVPQPMAGPQAVRR